MAVKKKKRSTKKSAARRKKKRQANQPAFLTTRQFNVLVRKTRNLRRRKPGAPAPGVTASSARPVDLSQGFDPVGDE